MSLSSSATEVAGIYGLSMKGESWKEGIDGNMHVFSFRASAENPKASTEKNLINL